MEAEQRCHFISGREKKVFAGAIQNRKTMLLKNQQAADLVNELTEALTATLFRQIVDKLIMALFFFYFLQRCSEMLCHAIDVSLILFQGCITTSD